jgi:murein DD-endopeptidase MepM/ murein hydrolase activator NlpD
MRLLIILLLLSSCATKDKAAKNKSAIKEKSKVVVYEPALAVTIMPGETRSIVYRLPLSKLEGKLFCDGKDTPFNIIENRLRAFISETYFSKFKPYQCVWKSGQAKIEVAKITVVKKDFPKERLTVNKRRVFLNKKDQKRVNKEREFKKKIYAAGSTYPLFDEAFELPIDSIETSIYGSQRIYNKKKRSQHLGTDFRAAVGTPIRAANSGKIIASRDLFYTGGTIIIDHGLEIFTIYAHLSELMVNEGDRVLKGQVIGLAGATGRVTGPHLHWGVKVNEMAVEGHSLISASREFVDKK